MTLPASGQISMSQVNTELGYSSSAAITLNNAAVRTLAGIASGAISLNDLHGKTYIYPIPSGLIIMSADGSTPSGWTRFSGADGYFICGAGNSYSVGAAAQTWSVSSVSSSSAGAHNNHPAVSIGGYIIYTAPANTSAGSHSHTAAISAYNLSTQRMVLIKANANGTVMPAQGMGFGISTLSGMSVFSATGFLNGYSSNGTVAESSSGTCSTNGAHTHENTGGYWAGTGPQQLSSGDHTHTLSITATQAIKRAVLRGLYQAAAYAPIAGLIGLWEGTSAPAGWTLCNGSNGTVDLRDYFIQFSTSGDGTRAGGNTIGFSIGLNTNSWTHNHTGATNPLQYDKACYPRSLSASHSHTASITATYVPARYALTFIQKL